MSASPAVHPVNAQIDGTGAYAVELDAVSAGYGGTPVVRDLSMHVPRGGIYGLVGPSGAGKTTTIRVLATLHQPDTGAVFVDGIDAQADPRAIRSRIGYLPDFSGVYEGLTVGEHVDFYASIYRIPPGRRRRLTDELLELAGLANQRETAVKHLSRGMKQQLGLARCLIHDPPILLLDGPASGMDPRSRLELRDILQELSRLDKTILISSNILSDLADVCTHLGIVTAGHMVAEGSTDEILTLLPSDMLLRVRLLDVTQRDRVEHVFEGHPACGECEAADESCIVTRFTGSDHDLTVILRELLANDVQVTEFTLEQRDLEDIFLLVTEAATDA